jgi:hypothetical protein
MGRRIYPPMVVGRNLTLEDLRGMGARNYRAAPESQALSIRITGEHLSTWKQLRAEWPEMSQTWIVEKRDPCFGG